MAKKKQSQKRKAPKGAKATSRIAKPPPQHIARKPQQKSVDALYNASLSLKEKYKNVKDTENAKLKRHKFEGDLYINMVKAHQAREKNENRVKEQYDKSYMGKAEKAAYGFGNQVVASGVHIATAAAMNKAKQYLPNPTSFGRSAWDAVTSTVVPGAIAFGHMYAGGAAQGTPPPTMGTVFGPQQRTGVRRPGA